MWLKLYIRLLQVLHVLTVYILISSVAAVFLNGTCVNVSVINRFHDTAVSGFFLCIYQVSQPSVDCIFSKLI